jgi:hypothetical protein
MRNTRSTALTSNGTLLDTAARIIKRNGNSPMSPAEIAVRGVAQGLLRVPRGRTRTYLSQLVQSTLYNESAYGADPAVFRTSRGQYKVRSRR